MTPRLTPRQAAVLSAAADGAPLSTVAARLGTTRTQIASRISEAYRALDVTWLPRAERRAEAVRIARRHGLIPADTQPDAAHTPDVPRRGPTTALRAPHTPSRLLAPHETATTPQTGTQPANAEQDTN